MATETDQRTIIEMLGDLRASAGEMRVFAEDARLASSECRDLAAQYPEEWVAFYGGALRAHAPTRDDVCRELEDLGVPRGRAVIRHQTAKPQPINV
jgi:hypothetical protein